ncbi:decarboxylase [Nocardia asteroides]|uniref:decarboxylase n=1 Tax=Nocardia asteroides TaxID=1824 RepID=UPI001E38BEF6|nr:decarboxylase [Nocardia asteroides]UGT61686.1 decarboxylase [Nocardia asteroides]
MTPPAVPALLDPLVREFVDTALVAVAARHGTPLHLVFPQVFARNAAALRGVLSARGVEHRLCYAHKVNRSHAFVRETQHLGLDIDIASAGELDSALGAGFPPARIEATGPKGERLLRRLLADGVTINVDNRWELDRIIALAEHPVPILLRVSGFPGTAVSRFGIPADEVDALWPLLAANHDRVALRGLSFHLDTGEHRDRLRAVTTCLALLESAWSAGLSPDVLDIGGGLRQVFTADPAAYDTYTRALRTALLGDGPPLTWAGATFGYRVGDGSVHGIPVFHKYANTVPATAALAALLDAEIPGQHRPLAAILTDNLLRLWLEPGKALADHAGITVASVEFTKDLPDGTVLVNLDLSRDQVTPADQEALVDPLLVPAQPPPEHPEPLGVFLAGRLCLERDMISNRAIRLPFRPRPGDLLVFPNTAGYHSDLSAGTAAMHPLPRRLAVTRDRSTFTAGPDAGHRPAEEGPCAPTTTSPN